MSNEPTPVTCVSLQIENFKRIEAFNVELAPGLNVIGGNNRQGKSSSLNLIQSALGGEKFTPSHPIHKGATKAKGHIELSNGVVVDVTYTKNGRYLKVTDGNGAKGGQALLKEFICEFALNIKSFMDATPERRANMLLTAIGVNVQPLDEKYKEIYAQRTVVAQAQARAKGHYESLPFHEEVGDELVTATELTEELTRRAAVNRGNAEARQGLDQLREDAAAHASRMDRLIAERRQLEERIDAIRRECGEEQASMAQIDNNIEIKERALADLTDEDTSEIADQIESIEETNTKVRDNQERAKAITLWENHKGEYAAMTGQLDNIKSERSGLLDGADMPLSGLTVEDGDLLFGGEEWDCMADSQQLIVSTAIVSKMNPRMGFVLVDKLEQFDLDTLAAYGEWLKERGLQAITTRVSQGDECTIIIEDGLVAE